MNISDTNPGIGIEDTIARVTGTAILAAANAGCVVSGSKVTIDLNLLITGAVKQRHLLGHRINIGRGDCHCCIDVERYVEIQSSVDVCLFKVRCKFSEWRPAVQKRRSCRVVGRYFSLISVREVAIILVIHMQANAKLPDVAGTLHAIGSLTDFLYGREQESHEQGYNGDDYK